MSSKPIKIYYQNTRGLRQKIIRGLKNGFTLADYDCVSLTETWLNANINSAELFDDSYNVFRADRSVEKYNILRTNRPNLTPDDDVTGGGSLIALKKNISASRMLDWEKEVHFDNVWLKLNTHGNSKIFINTIYIPGWAKFEHVNQYLEQLFDIINVREPNARFILLGDFNIPNIEWYQSGNRCLPIRYEGRLANELINTMTSTNTAQRNIIKNNFGKILDLVISNFNVSVSNATALVKVDIFHPPLRLQLDRSDIKYMTSTKTTKYNFFKANYFNLNREISAIKWENELNDTTIESSVDRFYTIINKLIKMNTPLIKPKNDEFPKWYSRDLIRMIKEKEFYRKKMVKPGGEIYIQLFSNKRREIKREKKNCIGAYENSIENLIKTNPKSFFAYTKAQKQSNNVPSTIFYGNKKAENMKESSELYAEYFSSVYVNNTNNFQVGDITNARNYFEINTHKIEEVIKRMDANKINSPDGIPMVFYKNTIESITKPLLLLFKKSLTEMNYPSKWKMSFITPILKSGDISNVENYRPVSILPAISKIFDKLIFLHLLNKVKHLLAHQQHGFTMGKSTITNLLEFTNYVANKMMKGGQIDTIYMDLAKAFDRIDHEILLKKLSRFPLDPCVIELIKSYLSNRTQIVCIGGEKSSPITPKSSVPQGSILSPLLFALFINDLPALIKTQILLFADDLKLFTQIKSLDDVRQLQMDINIISNWCRQNNLQLNIQKCFVMSFTRRNQATFQHFNYNINNIPLSRVETMKDLGVIFDSKLSFDAHINNAVTKAYKTLGFISRSLSKFKNTETYKILYFTYVRSHLEYCSSVWSPYYDNKIGAIERVQRRFTRSIYRKFRYPEEKHYCMRNIRLSILSLEDRRTIADEMILYKIYSLRLNTTLNHELQLNLPRRTTRFNNNIFYLPFVTTNVEYNAPMIRLQRQHDTIFHSLSLNEPNLEAYKRYVHNEMKTIQTVFDYSFER